MPPAAVGETGAAFQWDAQIKHFDLKALISVVNGEGTPATSASASLTP
jgi:hypothetical protein